MSLRVAREVGRLLNAVDHLQLNDVLSPGEASDLCRVICKKARRRGVTVTRRAPNGSKLRDNSVRVCWMNLRGRQLERRFAAYNVLFDPEE